MRFVFASYISFHAYTDPAIWLDRIKAYAGVMEALAINNEVISIEQINYEGDYINHGVNYHFKRFDKVSTYLPLKLNRYICRLKPDVVFIQSLHYPLQVMLLRLMLGRKTKIIIQNHAEKPFVGIKKRLVKLADRYVDAYLFASKAMGQNWIAEGNLSSPQKIYEVMELSSYFYPVDKNTARQKTGVTAPNAFLWVGRLDENKDPLTVVKAFLAFAATRQGTCLYMVYHTQELMAEVLDLLNSQPVNNAIKLVGQVPHGDMLHWYNSVDFIISGSHYEGSGTAVCEAMSCGCIPVVTDIFSFRMITDNGGIGLLYEAGHADELLLTLVKTEHLSISAEKQKALTYFKSNLSFTAIADKIEEIANIA
jgi:glycosyltransferase involved in cell wall biosynthesis